MVFNWIKKVGVGLAAVMAVMALADRVQAQGAGDLVVSPTRVVFEGRDRSATVTLANRGAGPATFRISIIEMQMDDTGNVAEMKGDNPNSAADMIRYAPRQIDIPAGGAQVVRLTLRKKADTAPGEYRSHLFFRAVPPENAGRSVTDNTPMQENELRIELVPIYGVTIPLIVRHGDGAAKAAIADLRVVPATENAPQSVQFSLKREGSHSLFGDAQVLLTPAGGGSEVVVGQITRIAVYTPNAARTVAVPLVAPDGVSLAGGTLRVVFRTTEDQGGTVLAEGGIKAP